ncbi:MAG: T9SS type A sorting domain-containing protein [Ignavibacteria bacterium]|nr:T9SS type A sorting domain-containing protein [Ignavibacteria bacterium]
MSWLLTAARRRDGADRIFLVRAAADNAATREASVSLYVQGAPLLARFRIPDTLTAVAGQTLSVPVTVDAATFGPVSSYRLLVAFDPSLLSLRDARAEGTLTNTGWDGPKYGMESIAPDGRAAVLQVSDSTSRVPLTGAGALVTLLFDVRAAALPGPWVRQTTLAFPRTVQRRDGVVRSDALNGHQDAADGVIAFEYRDGLATIADHCVVPLAGREGAAQLENAPNPFNPSTIIRFSLPRETAARLAVLDVYGRMVRLIADRGFAQGEHALRFDASDLPAGVYFCRLDADGASAVTKMILLK